jgi:magnesium transporter
MDYRFATYEAGQRSGNGTASLDEAVAARERNDFVWLELVDPQWEELQALRQRFDLPELAVEDAHHAHQRPKIDEYPNCLFVVLRTLTYGEAAHQCELGEIHLFIGADFVIVVRHGGDPQDLDQIRARAETRQDLMRLGAGAVLYAVMDEVVDDYEPVIENLASDIDTVEADVFARSGDDVTERVYRLKRSVLELRRAISPLILDIERLLQGQFPLIQAEMFPFFRDINDHLRRAEDRVETLRELLTGALQANVALVSVQQNEIVRKISGWAAIIAVPTLISGIYGMNFTHMPELDWTYGYPLALMLMLTVSTGLYLVLRRANWL